MHDLKPMEPGAMFWAERDTLAEIKSLGVRCGQLGFFGSTELSASAAAAWQADLQRESFTLVTVFAAYNGESYADIPTVARTVGFIPREFREEREKRTKDLSDFAVRLGVGSIACHIGCVPEDAADPDYVAVRDMVRRICDHAAKHGQTFALETGQEPAGVLLQFFHHVDRPNVRINFDPANMILYGSGEPVAALRALAPHVISVHCKDGDWPPKGVAGALGRERPLGSGAVGIPKFVQTLREIGFQGSLNVEREAENQQERIADMRKAIAWLKELTA
jgi:sugar phosphate isomerase/epimerase